MKTAPFTITAKIDTKKLEAAVTEYIAARQQAGKLPCEADVMHLIEQHVTFEDLRPCRKESEEE